MDLTTAARVRDRLEIVADDAKSLAQLAPLISRVSAQAERFMNRSVQTTSRTVQYDVRAGQLEFWLPAYPITSITSIYSDSLRSFGSETLVASTDYYYDATNGLLSFEAMPSSGRGSLKITYTGGMAATAAAFVTAYPDIAEAVDQQVVFLWSRRRSVGLTSVSEANGSISVVENAALLPEVKAILSSHRRMAHV